MCFTDFNALRLLIIATHYWPKEPNNISACARLWSETNFESFACFICHCVFSRCCFPCRFSFTEQPSITLYTPLTFSKVNFLFKITGNRKMPSTRLEWLGLNASSFFFRKFRWIWNLVHLSLRYWPHSSDVAFVVQLCPMGHFSNDNSFEGNFRIGRFCHGDERCYLHLVEVLIFVIQPCITYSREREKLIFAVVS